MSTGTRDAQEASLGMEANVHWVQGVDSKVWMGKFGVGGSLAVAPFPDAAGVVVVGGGGAGWASAKVVVAMTARARIKDV